jgi:hypothetical protein
MRSAAVNRQFCSKGCACSVCKFRNLEITRETALGACPWRYVNYRVNTDTYPVLLPKATCPTLPSHEGSAADSCTLVDNTCQTPGTWRGQGPSSSTPTQSHGMRKRRKYRLLYTSRRKGKPGPKSPSQELMAETLPLANSLPRAVSASCNGLTINRHAQAAPGGCQSHLEH